MPLQSDFYGLDINFPLGLVSATAGAVTATVATGGLVAANNGYVAALTAGAKTPVYLTNTGVPLAAAGQVAPALLSGSFSAVVNGNTTSVNYGQGAIVVLGLANLATVNGVANTPVPFNASGTPTLVAIVGPIVNVDVNGKLLGAENSVGQNGGNGVLAFPDIPDNVTPVAYFSVLNPAGSSTSIFTFGTTNWNATSITTTAYNLSVLPQRPALTF